jgi:GH24 family phage-related lysozyme (muramidase)
MQLSTAGLDLIKSSEGFKPHLYNDADGNATIAYGHLVHHGPICGVASEKPFANGISEQQGSELLMTDTEYAQHAIENLVKVTLTQGQYDALVSFTYNEGAGRLQSSTLLKVLNAGNYAVVPAQLMEWVFSGGEKLPGLVTRRSAEATLFAMRK